ncbi:DNA-binding protein c1d [Borealophlyctis nickersoniae]|nr:DNA-binding protein c1d [Borealophlyctis nickersoniae]
MDVEDILPDLPAHVGNLEAAVGKVEELLKPLLAAPFDQHASLLPPLDRAKLDVVVAFALTTLMFAFLKTQGVPPKDHPVRQEIDRIKSYVQKIRGAAGQDNPNMRVDSKVAGRFIHAALSANEEVKGEIQRRKANQNATSFLEEIQQSVAAQSPKGGAEQAQPSEAEGQGKKKKDKGKGKEVEVGAVSSPTHTSPTASPGLNKRKLGDEGADVETPPSSPNEGPEKKKKKKKKSKLGNNE